MLRLIPPPLHRAGLRVAHGLRTRWWRLRTPRVTGCRIIAIDGEDRVLLIRHSYGSDCWMPPGGGLARGEDPLLAAARELQEETGCRLGGAHLISEILEDLHGADNHVHVIGGRTGDLPMADGREVIEAAFFRADDLPEAISPRLRPMLHGWITAAIAGRPADALPDCDPPAPTG